MKNKNSAGYPDWLPEKASEHWGLLNPVPDQMWELQP